MTGSLPNDIGETMFHLRHLHLDHNKFRGTIPLSYNSVGNGRLESLTLHDNQLTGVVPGPRPMYNKLTLVRAYIFVLGQIDSELEELAQHGLL